MTREALIKSTVENLEKLSDNRLKEVSDFTEFLLSKIDDNEILKGIHNLVSDSESFEFLVDEEDLYSPADLKDKFYE